MDQFSSMESQIKIGNLLELGITDLFKARYTHAKKIILVDEHTKELCLPHLFMHLDGLEEAEIIEIPAGEENKSMEICISVWETLSEMEFGRSDLMICLGGGVICDMGGFISSVYKRGMNCMYIPTTLLCMVDASLGGKTGVNLGAFKNQLGTIVQPGHVFIDLAFLETLPENEKINGWAEMLKHGLIADASHFKNLAKKPLNEINALDIVESLKIKSKIVEMDTMEQGPRKLLNFGHTIAHAIEGALMHSNEKMSHGLAVAHGILVEAYISVEIGLLDKRDWEELQKVMREGFPLRKFTKDKFESFLQFMKQDKKNSEGNFRFTLLKRIGEGAFDIEVSVQHVRQALNATLSSDV
jgi:3-dehydroquinate synthase